jgi:transglutaminase-like putative cysteine protease
MRWLLALTAAATLGNGGVDLAARRVEPAPISLVVAEVVGPRVTVGWEAPAGAPPDLYLLEGGVTPGQVLASLPVSSSTSSLTVTLGRGTYYVRLHALRNGVRSAASNEVRIGVELDAAPSAPRDLAALALGSDVALSWRATFEGGATDAVVLDVQGPITGSVPLQATGEISFGSVPSGTYTLTLRAQNENGTSSSSAPVTLKVPGATIQPLASPRLPSGTARLPVRYEVFTAPRLTEYGQREGLGAVVQGASTEFEAILRLKEWVAAQFPTGSPSPYPPWDAMTILDWIRTGYTGGFCGQYSQVFLQALAAFGVPARYLEVGTTTNPYAHYVTEVWSNDFNKWVLLDVTFNHHFVRDGEPMSVLEVRDALLGNELDHVGVVLGAFRSGHPSPSDFPQRTAELYYYARYHLNANHVAAPAEPPFERYLDMVEWLDGQTTPWELSTTPSEFPHERPTAAETGDRMLVDWAPNQVWIASRRSGVMEVTLDLQHSILLPNHYEYRVIDADGAAGPWTPHASSALVWKVAATDRVLEVRGVNLKGIRGQISSVHVAIS